MIILSPHDIHTFGMRAPHTFPQLLGAEMLYFLSPYGVSYDYKQCCVCTSPSWAGGHAPPCTILARRCLLICLFKQRRSAPFPERMRKHWVGACSNGPTMPPSHSIQSPPHDRRQSVSPVQSLAVHTRTTPSSPFDPSSMAAIGSDISASAE